MASPIISATLGPLRTVSTRLTASPETRAGEGPSTYSRLLSSVKEAGLMRRARGFYAVVFSSLVLATVGLGVGFWLLGDTWYQLIIAGALGLVLTQFAFLTHETSHRQVFASGKANDRAGRILAAGVVGISYAWWMNKHTRHHQHPNTIGKDPDIEVDTISFIEEDAAKRTGLMAMLTRKQGYLFFPLLTLEGLNLHFQSIKGLFAKRPIQGRALEITLIGVRLAAYLGVIFWLLPIGMAFAFIGVQLAVFGVYMGASFAPNHKGMALIPAGVKVDFLRRQVLTSRNIRGGFGMDVLYGGLNMQIEHHLFPGMARPHLHRARALVKAACENEGLTYTEATMTQSYARVIEYLNRVGLAARDPFDCPALHQYGS
jgi:fatty acid desaturase